MTYKKLTTTFFLQIIRDSCKNVIKKCCESVLLNTEQKECYYNYDHVNCNMIIKKIACLIRNGTSTPKYVYVNMILRV
nr:hypothetical protein [Cnaphalocrocis medinalis granulovirus]